MAFPKFFLENEFFIDERIGLFKFSNNYKVYDKDGNQIGTVEQQLGVGQKLLQLLINKAMMPFHFQIKDRDEVVVASLKRGWTFWMSKVSILNQDEQTIGFIKQKFKLFSPEFFILDENERTIASVKGDWKAWDFQIVDENGSAIGTINKKWGGAMRELFTTADKYKVLIDESLKEDQRKIAIVVAAITVDMLYKEAK